MVTFSPFLRSLLTHTSSPGLSCGSLLGLPWSLPWSPVVPSCTSRGPLLPGEWQLLDILRLTSQVCTPSQPPWCFFLIRANPFGAYSKNDLMYYPSERGLRTAHSKASRTVKLKALPWCGGEGRCFQRRHVSSTLHAAASFSSVHTSLAVRKGTLAWKGTPGVEERQTQGGLRQEQNHMHHMKSTISGQKPLARLHSIPSPRVKQTALRVSSHLCPSCVGCPSGSSLTPLGSRGWVQAGTVVLL